MIDIVRQDRHLTIQVNLSPGDVDYAEVTVPALLKSHENLGAHKLAIVDCCRPQKTRIVDRDRRFPKARFVNRVESIRRIAESFRNGGLFDEVVYLTESDTPLFQHISEKYYGTLLSRGQTHDFGGTAVMSYLAALEFCKTPYLLHYDADMFLYQKPGYDWARNGIDTLSTQQDIVNVVPRRSPPFATGEKGDAPSLHEGRPFVRRGSGWVNDWFSTRYLLLDMAKLRSTLPLVQGLEHYKLLVYKLLKRRFPRSPEILFFRHFPRRSLFTFNQDSELAWVVHPNNKGAAFLNCLRSVLDCVEAGEFPIRQAGYEDLDLAAWDEYLASKL